MLNWVGPKITAVKMAKAVGKTTVETSSMTDESQRKRLAKWSSSVFASISSSLSPGACTA